MKAYHNKTDSFNTSKVTKTHRPARSIKEIRQRQLGDAYQSPWDRLVYALLNGLMYGFGGLLIDVVIVVVRSIADIGNGEIFWLFAPFMLVLGVIIGLVVGKNAGAESVNALHIDETANHNPYLDDTSISHDIFRGLIVGIAIFAVIWLAMMFIM